MVTFTPDFNSHLSHVASEIFRIGYECNYKICFFVLILFITVENMSSIHTEQKILGVNENFACNFHIRWNQDIL